MRKTPTSWIASKISGSKLKQLGVVYADTEAEAITEACKEHNVPEADRKRIVVRRMG
jgi:hypothetical protein